MKEKIIHFLLNNADPSIVLRTKKEVLNYISEKEEGQLLGKIIHQKKMQSLIQSQKPDGWLGNEFHGQSGGGVDNNMEVGLRYLAEKGLPPENEYVSKAVGSFLLDEPLCNEFRLKAPADDYEYTAFALYLLRSSVIIRAGYENLLPENDSIDLKHDIDVSYKTFINVLNYANVDDVVDASKRKFCFNTGVLWPCSYDLRILAHSQGWRMSNNVSLLADSLNHLFSFSHDMDKMIYTLKDGQFRSPCLAFIHNQMYCLGLMDEKFFNYDLMELFARCGVVKQVDFLKKKYDYMLSLVDENLCINYKVDTGGNSWNPYFGFALEEDWKTKVRKQCDLLFRFLLIIHYAD